MNPAFPHPDQDGEVTPMQLDEAIALAIKVLRDPTADQWLRRKAADDLQYAMDCNESA